MEGIKLDTKIQPWDERKRDLEEAEEVERQEQARIAQEATRNRRPQSDVQPPDAKRRRTETEEGFDPQEGTSSNQATANNAADADSDIEVIGEETRSHHPGESSSTRIKTEDSEAEEEFLKDSHHRSNDRDYDRSSRRERERPRDR